jgi:3'-5' exoribonuclease
MKEIFIKDLRKDQEVTDFFMAKTLAVKVGSNGKQYLDVTLGDKTGEISGKKWDVSDAEYQTLKAIEDKTIVKVKGVVTEWAGQLQMRIQRIRPVQNEDEQQMSDFVKAAPEDPVEMYEFIWNLVNDMQDDEIKLLLVRLLHITKKSLCTIQQHRKITMLRWQDFCTT